MSKDKIIVGIDPDTVKSGFAVYSPKNKQIMTLQTFDLVDLMEALMMYKQIYDLSVNLEAGWLKKGTWHKGGNGMAKRVGACNEIGKQLEKFLVKQGIPYKLIEPQGYSSYKHEYFCKLTGWPARIKTNSETRVAAMLTWGY